MTRPRIVCLCGSTKFRGAYERANREETLAGRIVLTVGFFGHQEAPDRFVDKCCCTNAMMDQGSRCWACAVRQGYQLAIDDKARSDRWWLHFDQEVKPRLDALHLAKIDLADEVLVLNVGGYIGDSTRREINYAESHGKPVRYLELAA